MDKAQEENENPKAAFLSTNDLIRIRQAKESLEHVSELKEKISEARETYQREKAKHASSSWKYIALGVAAAPIILWGLSLYFNIGMDISTYYAKIKNTFNQDTNITLSGTVGVENGDLFCKVEINGTDAGLLVKGTITGPENFKKDFVLVKAAGRNEIIFKTPFSKMAKGVYVCNVTALESENLGDLSQNFKGGPRTVARLTVQ